MSRLGVMLMLSIVLTGCVTMDQYNVVIKNTGKKKIDSAHVLYGGFRSIGGILIAGSKKGQGRPEYPIPDSATVEWRTDDGVMHRKDVDVRKLVPKGFRGDIQFEIDDDNNVTVRIIPEAPEGE